MGGQDVGKRAEAVLAVLHCPECAEDVPHRVTYRLGTVVETVCTQCDRTLLTPRRQRAAAAEASGGLSRRLLSAVVSSNERSSLFKARSSERSALSVLPISPRRVGLIAVSLPVRALTKPGRLWQEMRREGPGVLLTVPRRAATKPVRLAVELAGRYRSAR